MDLEESVRAAKLHLLGLSQLPAFELKGLIAAAEAWIEARDIVMSCKRGPVSFTEHCQNTIIDLDLCETVEK